MHDSFHFFLYGRDPIHQHPPLQFEVAEFTLGLLIVQHRVFYFPIFATSRFHPV